MKRQLVLLTYGIVMLLAGFIAGQFMLKRSVAEQIYAIATLYNPMENTVFANKGDLGITVSLVDKVMNGDLNEFYRLSCLQIELTADSLREAPPEYAKKYGVSGELANASEMLRKLQARGYGVTLNR